MTEIITRATLEQAGQLANIYAANNKFAEYQARKAENTLRGQRADLTAFATFLGGLGTSTPTPEKLYTDPAAWVAITWGLVEAFKVGMLQEGNSIATINRRLATIKVYANLAYAVGVITLESSLLIANVDSYGKKEGKRVNDKRDVVRIGFKKATPTPISTENAVRLKVEHPNTAQGRRDRLLMSLLLDQGLRIEEIALLTVENFDLDRGVMVFDRPKVDLTDQVHELSPHVLSALADYKAHGDCPASGSIWRKSIKGGTLGEQGVTIRNLHNRVKVVAERLDIKNLSPHDCRHYWATFWADKVGPFRLQEAGGWSSLEMPRRYVARTKIANKGMV